MSSSDDNPLDSNPNAGDATAQFGVPSISPLPPTAQAFNPAPNLPQGNDHDTRTEVDSARSAVADGSHGIATPMPTTPITDAGFLSPSSVPAPTWTDPGTASNADGMADSEYWVNTQLRVLRPHAKGGIGEVLIAYDEQVGREVALKRIQPRHVHSHFDARFLLEAEVTGQLEHPGVVPIYGIGHAHGRPYYVMRLIQGTCLRVAVEKFHDPHRAHPLVGERLLELRQLLSRFIAVCYVIDYAHSRGILHRDLKPDNIMLGDYGETLVVDWGLAKKIGDPAKADHEEVATFLSDDNDSRGSSAQTVAGSVMGTPGYMSPEQAAGQIDQLGPATDIYGLGATLYSILTGQRMATSQAATEVVGRVSRPPKPETNVFAKDTPKPLAAICQKATAIRPEDRYAAARELASDIENWLADEPVSAYHDPLTTRTARWFRRHRTIATGVAALVLTTTVALAVSTVLISNQQALTEAARTQAVANLGIAQSQRQAAQTARAAEADAREQAVEKSVALEHQLYMNRIPLAFAKWGENDSLAARQLLLQCPDSLRGWEWNHLWKLCYSEVQALQGHTGLLTSVAYSPDGKWIGSAGTDGTTRIWQAGGQAGGEAGTGNVKAVLRGSGGGVQAVAFSPSNREIAIGYFGGILRVFDISTGEVRREESIPVGSIDAVAYSPDGQWIAAGGFDGVLRIWTAAEKDGVVRQWTGHQSRITKVAYTPDGRAIATSSLDKTVRIWEFQSPPPPEPDVRVLEVGDPATAVAFAPGGESLAIAMANGRTEIRSLDGFQPVQAFQHSRPVTHVAFSPNGEMIATASLDRSLGIWSIADGRRLFAASSRGGSVQCVVFSPDGQRLVAGGFDGQVHIYRVKTGPRQGELLPDTIATPDIRALAVCPTQPWLALSRDSKDRDPLEVWDIETGTRIRKFSNASRVNRVNFSRDGRLLAAAYVRSSKIEVFNLDDNTSFRLNAKIPDHLSLCFSADNRWLAAVGETGSGVFLYDLSTRRMVRNYPGLHAAFSPTEPSRLATAGADGVVRLFDVTSDKVPAEVIEFKGHSGPVYVATFDPEGKRIVSAGFDQTIRVWDIARVSLRQTLTGHTESIRTLAFNRRGDRLISTADDQTLRLWDPDMDHEILTLDHSVFASEANGAAFTANDHRIAAVTSDGQVVTWDTLIPQASIPSTLSPAKLLDQSRASEARGDWASVADLFQQAFDAGLTSQNLLDARAFAASQAGRWNEVDSAWAAFVLEGNRKAIPMANRCLASLAARDMAAYRSAAAELFAEHGNINNGPQALWWVVVGTTLGDAGFSAADREKLIEFAQKGVRMRGHDPSKSTFLGIALYRAGRLDDAAKRLKAALPLHAVAMRISPDLKDLIQLSEASCRWGLCRVYHDLGREEELRDGLVELRRVAATLRDVPATNNPSWNGTGFGNWGFTVFAAILENEIKTLDDATKEH